MATAAQKTASAAEKTVKSAADTKTAKSTTEDAFATTASIADAGRDQFGAAFEQFNENAKTFQAQAEDMFAAYRENYEVVQKRVQSANADLISAAREETAEAVDFVNELARAKTVSDALEIQRDYWTNLFNTRVQRSRELADVSVETARESMEPLAKAMSAFSKNAAFEKFFPFAGK